MLVQICCYILFFAVIVTAEVWFPVFIAYEKNGQSVHDSWKTPALCNEIPTTFAKAGKGKHLRSNAIDYWSDMNIKKVKVELYKNNVKVVWMTFNGINTNSMNWFSKSNLYQSSFADLSTCSQTNFFSIEGHFIEGRHTRRFYVNKLYDDCPGDIGWFAVLETNDVCSWGQFNKYPIFRYTRNGGRWATGTDCQSNVSSYYCHHLPPIVVEGGSSNTFIFQNIVRTTENKLSGNVLPLSIFVYFVSSNDAM